MGRHYLLFLILFFCFSLLSAQTVDSIRVEQSGDFIRISYQILNSKPSEIYRVKVLCSLDGGLNIELRSITGDVGDQIIGGKPEYWLVWDVLKDFDEIGSVEFIIRAELLKSLEPLQKIQRDRKGGKFSLIATGFLPGPGYGARLSFTRKVGVSVLAVRGKAVILPNPANFNPSVDLFRVGLGLTIRLAGNENNQVHLLVGNTIGQVLTDQYLAEDRDWKKGLAPGFEAGTIIHLKRFSFSISGSHILQSLVEEEPAMSKITFLNAGIGFNF
jgi:hypothetical protein